MKPSSNVATLIEHYFTERLIRQRNVSGNTIASYRDTFRLLFMFAMARLHKPPSALALGDLDAPFISAFLEDLEANRGAGVRTRNLRLTAIRSFFRFASFEEPAYSAHIRRVLAIPSKRHDKRQVDFLTRPEIEAILAAPDRTTWLGRRDYSLLLLAVQTGCRQARRHSGRCDWRRPGHEGRLRAEAAAQSPHPQDLISPTDPGGRTDASYGFKSRIVEWSRPPEPSSAASGILVRTPRAPTVGPRLLTPPTRRRGRVVYWAILVGLWATTGFFPDPLNDLGVGGPP